MLTKRRKPGHYPYEYLYRCRYTGFKWWSSVKPKPVRCQSPKCRNSQCVERVTEEEGEAQ